MKIKPEYTLLYDLDAIYIVRRNEDGTTTEISQISDSAAMAWDGYEHGVDRDRIIEAIAQEFDGASADMVEADLAVLEQQLIALGYAEA